MHITEITPEKWARLAPDIVLYWGVQKTSFGDILLVVSQKGKIFVLSFVRQNPQDTLNSFRFLKRAKHLSRNDEKTAGTWNFIRARLEENAPENPEKPIEIALVGTVFSQAVWRTLLKIPRGSACSYKDIAGKLGKPQMAQAVGQAVGANPVCWLVPCHRVISQTGDLGGYAGGLSAKQKLLAAEGVFLSLKTRTVFSHQR